MVSWDLIDINALALGHCTPSSIMSIYQANTCYNFYLRMFLKRGYNTIVPSIKFGRYYDLFDVKRANSTFLDMDSLLRVLINVNVLGGKYKGKNQHALTYD